MGHTCNRDDCPPENVKGPKALCFACKKLCYFACYGVAVNQSNSTSYNGKKNDYHFASTSHFQFICAECLSSPSSASSQSQLNDSITTPKSDKITIRAIMTEVVKLHDQLKSLQTSSNETNDKLDTIDVKTNDIKSNTDAVLTKIDLQLTNNNGPFIFGSSAAATRPFRPMLNRGTPITANINGSSTPCSAKRRRPGTPASAHPSKKRSFPSPQMGTNTNVGKLVIVDKPVRQKPTEKISTHEKAIWVSRFAPNTSEDDIRHYIAIHTSASPNINVRKLVKKDQDLSKLNFVSFKIEVNASDFAILNDKSAWPVNVPVRAFEETVKPKPVTLGDFLTNNLNGQQTRKSPTNSNAMIVEDSPSTANAS